MGDLTPKLDLYKPGGGSTGLITPDEVVDIDVINANMDKIDEAMGANTVTSVTRPATPYDGEMIYETDTEQIRIYRADLDEWVAEASSRGSRTIFYATDLNNVAGLVAERVGDLLYVDEGDYFMVSQNGTVWMQLTDATFVDQAAANTAFAKASDAYKIQGHAYYLDSTTGIRWGWYELYNAGTKPGGAKVAGWYPVPGGSELGGSVVRSATAWSLAVGTAIWPATALTDTLTGAIRPLGLPAFSVDNGWKVPVEGLYEVTLKLDTGSAQPILVGWKKNSVTADWAGSVARHSLPLAAGVVAGTAVARVPLAANDIIRANYGANAVAAVGAAPETAMYSIRFIEPLRE